MKQFLEKLFGTGAAAATAPLYAAIVARGRAPHWYVEGGVADTIDGRFDMITAVLALVLIRLEQDEGAADAGVALTEHFIADMDAQLRQSGVGDVGVGKQVGKLVSALGGRIGAYRDGLAADDLETPLLRNLYRGVDPGAAARAHVAATLSAFADDLARRPTAALIAGGLP